MVNALVLLVFIFLRTSVFVLVVSTVMKLMQVERFVSIPTNATRELTTVEQINVLISRVLLFAIHAREVLNLTMMENA